MSQRKKKIEIASDEEVAQYGGGRNGNASAESDVPEETSAENGGEQSPDEAVPETSATDTEDWKDKFLRARAELANFQRRSEKDRNDALRYANAGLVRALLPVIDDIERIIAAGREHKDSADQIIEGIQLTLDNCLKALRQFGIEAIDAKDQPFDPQVHEAMMQQPSAEHDERVVLQELARGYKLHDRVLRPAKVIVSQPIESAESESEE